MDPIIRRHGIECIRFHHWFGKGLVDLGDKQADYLLDLDSLQ